VKRVPIKQTLGSDAKDAENHHTSIDPASLDSATTFAVMLKDIKQVFWEC
jgi:hypothetical protein